MNEPEINKEQNEKKLETIEPQQEIQQQISTFPQPYPQPQQTQPIQQPIPQQIAPPQKITIDLNALFSLKMLTIGIAIGLLLTLIGNIVIIVAESDGTHDLGKIIDDIGIFAVVGALLIGGLINDKIATNIRAGMFIAAGIILLGM